MRPRPRPTAYAVVGVLVTVLCLACTPARPWSRPSSASPAAAEPARWSDVPLVPLTGTYPGAYDGGRSPAAAAAALGRAPQMHLTSVGWQYAWSTDPVLAEDATRGQVSLVNWEPFDVDLADVLGGRAAAMLERRAAERPR